MNNTTHVEETNKIAEIKDSFDRLRYKVILTTSINELTQKNQYQVEVLNCFSAEVPEQIYVQSGIVYYGFANELYESMVSNYKHLIKCEEKHLGDINLYKEKIDYKHVECCKNCEFAKTFQVYCDDKFHMHEIYECHNPKNFIICKTDEVDDHFSDDRFDDEQHHLSNIHVDINECQKQFKTKINNIVDVYKYDKRRYNCNNLEFLPIHVKVDADGHCKNYLNKNFKN